MNEVKLHRIGWLDSCNQPSRVHLTSDNGSTTICGHLVKWKIAKVPTNTKSQSRYCKTCFLNQKKKSLEWIDEIKTSQNS